MPTITKRIGEFEGDLVRLEVDYDSGTLRLLALRSMNNSGQAAYGQATQTASGRTHGIRFGPGTTEMAIPTAVQQRLVFSLDDRGRLDGVTFSTAYPYP